MNNEHEKYRLEHALRLLKVVIHAEYETATETAKKACLKALCIIADSADNMDDLSNMLSVVNDETASWGSYYISEVFSAIPIHPTRLSLDSLCDYAKMKELRKEEIRSMRAAFFRYLDSVNAIPIEMSIVHHLIDRLEDFIEEQGKQE